MVPSLDPLELALTVSISCIARVFPGHASHVRGVRHPFLKKARLWQAEFQNQPLAELNKSTRFLE
jgi:hypothetical protein